MLENIVLSCLKELKKMSKFNIGDRVILKENLVIVEIVKMNKKDEYGVIYPHLKEPHEFWVKEDELEEKPINYDQKIFNAYIEYYYKYNQLLERLYSASKRKRF